MIFVKGFECDKLMCDSFESILKYLINSARTILDSPKPLSNQGTKWSGSLVSQCPRLPALKYYFCPVGMALTEWKMVE